VIGMLPHGNAARLIDSLAMRPLGKVMGLLHALNRACLKRPSCLGFITLGRAMASWECCTDDADRVAVQAHVNELGKELARGSFGSRADEQFALTAKSASRAFRWCFCKANRASPGDK
jgi:hypothetical protein